MNAGIRTRFAPSPTGRLHIGSVRTALFNWLFARHSGGSFILRIEDTDTARSTLESEKGIIEDLGWLGLDHDEGPDIGGKKGPYRQSERLGIYTDSARFLIEKGAAYNCYCSKERLETLRASQIKAGMPPRYDGRCRDISPNGAPKDALPSIRFRVPDKTVYFSDIVHGDMRFDKSAFGDFVIIGSDGIASYNFAAAVDDALMAITHIIRGDDHISNTPRQILVFEALGHKPPAFAHIPLVLTPERTPLGKRDLSASLDSLREEGFLPEAVINSSARLGWSFGDEFLTLNEMARIFSIKRLSAAPSVFDRDRLKSFNRAAIERLGAQDLIRLTGIDPDAPRVKEIISAVKPNAVTLGDIKTLSAPFISGAEYSAEALAILSEPYSRTVIDAFVAEFKKTDIIDETACGRITGEVKKITNEKGKRLFMPLRCALTGMTEGIELARAVELLGKEEILSRLEKAKT
ncbi:MAG: glutamate--tRNA ligase [Deltaproteobacteria bacterium]|nr:glutamate--tRNA ligase [Deltaproteobacteria bacterium]